jgi:hypothetical protein
VHVRHGFFEAHVTRRHHDNGEIFVDERDRPVLQLSGGIALSVNVGYFLELERAFQRKRVVRSAVGTPLSWERSVAQRVWPMPIRPASGSQEACSQGS